MSLSWDLDGLFSLDNRPVLHCILSMLDIIKELDSCTRSLLLLGEYYFTTTKEMYNTYHIYAISLKSNSHILDIYCSSDILYDSFDNNLLLGLNKHGLDAHYHITELGYNRNFLSYSILSHLRENKFNKYTLYDCDNKFIYLFDNNLYYYTDFKLSPLQFSGLDFISYFLDNNLNLFGPLYLDFRAFGIQVVNPYETISNLESLMLDFLPLLSRYDIVLKIEFYKLYDLYRYYYLGNHKDFYLKLMNWIYSYDIKIYCKELDVIGISEEELLSNKIYHNYEEVYSLFFKDRILFSLE